MRLVVCRNKSTDATDDTIIYAQAYSQVKVRWKNLNCVQMLLSGLLVTKYLAEGMGEFPITNIPAARVGTPEDVAGTALYLASRAGAFVNGATITVDGGTS